LSEKLTGSINEKSLVASSTKNIEAYNLYLQGLFYWNKYSADCAKKALKFYHEAIRIEPEFALAHAAISGCYVFLAAIGYMSSKSAYSKAKEFALKSLNLDNNLSESQLSLAMVKFFFDWDWDGAEECFQKAIELNPGSAAVHHNYTLYLLAMGRVKETVQEAKKALMLDPLSLVNNNSLGNAYFYAGRHDDAIEQLEKTLELDPNFIIALNNLGWICLDLGKIDRALHYFKKAQRLPGHAVKRIAPLGYAHTKAGNIEKAKKCLEKLKKRAEMSF
jgi:Tfp pilus assembly protein PilF